MPSKTLVNDWFSTIPPQDILYALRLHAFQAYEQTNINDHECARALTGSLNWESVKYAPACTKKMVHVQAEHYWLADVHDAILLVPTITKVLEQLFVQPLSPAALLAGALFTRCMVLYISARVTEHDVITCTTELSGQLSIEQLIIYIEPHAQVTIALIQKLQAAVSLCSVIVVIGAHAHVTMVQEQEANPNGCLTSLVACVQEHAQLTVLQLSTKNGTHVSWADINLLGRQAVVDYTNICALKAQEQYALITQQRHKEYTTQSSITIKQVLQEQARSFYRGNITIGQEGSGSNASQQHTALMLSDNARVCAIPALEIKTDEVRCQHGTAAGYLQKEHVWYLQSRGLEKQQAHKLIIDGFLTDTVTRKFHYKLEIEVIKRLQDYVLY